MHPFVHVCEFVLLIGATALLTIAVLAAIDLILPPFKRPELSQDKTDDWLPETTCYPAGLEYLNERVQIQK